MNLIETWLPFLQNPGIILMILPGILTGLCEYLLEIPLRIDPYMLQKQIPNFQKTFRDIKQIKFGIRQKCVQLLVLFFIWLYMGRLISIQGYLLLRIRWAQVNTQSYLHFTDEETKS